MFFPDLVPEPTNVPHWLCHRMSLPQHRRKMCRGKKSTRKDIDSYRGLHWKQVAHLHLRTRDYLMDTQWRSSTL
ncbi:unnamed protein product [Haemonchus placei]|uniref:Uncharacterized protein n=1 Tax=Haemonchus placei TaxID=6290 RepID=A0A3P7Y9C2_HAEPC|nr:unnamed protein product [Haemonchus placei]